MAVVIVPLRRAKRVIGSSHCNENTPRTRQQRPAGRRQGRTVYGAIEKRRANLILEALHRVRNGRLRAVERWRRAGKLPASTVAEKTRSWSSVTASISINSVFGLLETLINIPKSRVLGVDTTGIISNFQGARFPYSPTVQAIGDAQYTFSLIERRSLFLGGSAVYHSRTSGSLDAAAPLTIDPYTLLDLRAGVDSKDGSWRFSVCGRNVTNTLYWTSAIRTVDTYVRQAGMPATYGISLTLRNR